MTTYSWASQSRRYDSSYPTQRYTGGPNKGVLHTTETTALPGYAGGGNAPHLTGVPDFGAKRVRWYQHFDSDRPARALADRAGGVQTNNDGAFQVELVGSCSKSYVDKYGGMFWPEAPEWALEEVRLMMRRVGEDRGIPFAADVEWLPYPSSYGNTSVRMSQSTWDRYAGWCGHQHVPENDHGDPGDMSALFQEDDMYTDKDRERDEKMYEFVRMNRNWQKWQAPGLFGAAVEERLTANKDVFVEAVKEVIPPGIAVDPDVLVKALKKAFDSLPAEEPAPADPEPDATA